MSHYTIEYRPPRLYPGGPARGWIALSVSAPAPFSVDELRLYRQQIAEALTMYRGVAVMPDAVRMRTLCDGAPIVEHREL